MGGGRLNTVQEKWKRRKQMSVFVNIRMARYFTVIGSFFNVKFYFPLTFTGEENEFLSPAFVCI